MKQLKRRGRPKEIAKVDTSVNGKSFLRTLLDHPDLDKAQTLLEQLSGLDFDQANIEEVERLGLDGLETRFEKSTNFLNQLEKKRDNTKRWIKGSVITGDSEKSEVPFRKWRTKDKGIFIFAFLMAGVVMVTGGANVFSNLMASGIPVFLEKPWLAVLLCVVVPAGSAALKFFYDYLSHDTARKIYAIAVYGATALSLLAWTILFAIQFPGTSGELDLNSLFEEGSHLDTLFVWTQLVSEVFCGAALFLVAGDVFTKYSPDYFFQNPEFIEIEKNLKQHCEKHEVLEKELNEVRGLAKKLESARKSYIKKQVAEFESMRSRFKDFDANRNSK